MQKPNNAALAASTQPEAVQAGKKRVKKPAPGRKKRRTGAQSTGLGLSTKIVIFLTLVLFAFAAVGLLISSTNFRDSLRSGLAQEGTAAAATLATIAPSFLAAGDTTELQTLASQEAGISEAYYVWISNNQGEVIVHTFVPFIPQEVVQAAATVSEEGIQLTYRNLETNQIQKRVAVRRADSGRSARYRVRRDEPRQRERAGYGWPDHAVGRLRYLHPDRGRLSRRVRQPHRQPDPQPRERLLEGG